MNHMQVLVCLVSSATSGSTWAFAVSADLDINELGDSDDTDTGVQDDAEIFVLVNKSLGSSRDSLVGTKSGI